MEARQLSFLDETFYWGRSGKQATVLVMRCSLAQAVDRKALQDALFNALRAHTNFRIRPVIIDGRIRAEIGDVAEVPLYSGDGRPRHLGTDETKGYMLYVTYEEKDITIHVFHGITDLRGLNVFLGTLIRSYFHELGMKGINPAEPDSMDAGPCYEDILKNGAPGEPRGMFNPEEHEIFNLPEETYGKETTRQRMFEIDAPLMPLLSLSRESQSSLVPTAEAIIGHAIHETYEVGKREVVAYTPIDLRAVFHCETGGNGASSFSLPYPAELNSYGIHERAKILRSSMDIQIRPENLYAGVAALMGRMQTMFRMPYPIEAISQRCVNNRREKDARFYTYGVSYSGKLSICEEIDPQIASVTVFAASYSYPLWIMACEINGVVRMTAAQNFESDKLIRNIYQELAGYIPGTVYRDLGYYEFDEFHLSELRHL